MLRKVALFFSFLFALVFGVFLFINKSKEIKLEYIKNETSLSFIDKEKLLKKISAPPQQWMMEQINKDFQAFQLGGISKQQVDETFTKIKKANPHPYIVRYRIIDNELYRYFPENESISIKDNGSEKALKTLLYLKSFKDMDFIFSYLDGIPLPDVSSDFYITDESKHQAPVFYSAKQEQTPYVILIPDWRSLCKWWYKNIKRVRSTMSKIHWENKRDYALWRGSTSNKRNRIRLCQLSKQNPQILDAKINTVSKPPEVQKLVEEEGLWGQRVSWEELLQAKYAPTLDGICTASPSFQWRLLSNSVTLKQVSNEIQWFYRALNPYEHYIPVENDLSDFFQKIEWAKEHDRQCKEMADRSTDFVLNNLMVEDVYHYLFLVLDRYQSLQDLSRQELKNQVKDDHRWVNIHDRKKLARLAKQQKMKGFTEERTPFVH